MQFTYSLLVYYILSVYLELDFIVREKTLILYICTEFIIKCIFHLSHRFNWLDVYLFRCFCDLFHFKKCDHAKGMKKTSLLRLYEWNLWYEIIMWFTFPLLSAITNQIFCQKLVCLKNSFNILSEYSLQEI